MDGVFGSRSGAFDGARQLSRRFSSAIIVLMLAVAAILYVGLNWATRGSDEISVERQMRVAKHSIDIGLDAIALQQETVAVWDESAHAMFQDKKDQTWLRYNVTDWLNRMFGHNLGILLDADEKPVQVAIDGKPAALSEYGRFQRDFAPLLDSVYGRQKGEPGKHDRMPGQPLAPVNNVQTTKRAVHDTHLMLVNGRPAMASAMLIKPSTEGYVGQRDKWPVLISARYLDAGFMDELETRYLIASPRFARVDNRRTGETAQVLKTEWGDPLGFLIWTPELPGSRLLAMLAPAALAALLLLGALMFFLTTRLERLANERARLEEEAARLAYHDSLTGLPNRRLFLQKLCEALADGNPHGQVALLMIDIDQFKQVNDLLGHLAGDELIRQFATRLETEFAQQHVVARLGGDELALLMTVNGGIEEVEKCGQQALASFERPFRLLDQEIVAGASIGGALADRPGLDATELMRRADVALYRAKADGRNCARVFHEAMDAATQQRSRLASDMRRALASSGFSISAQPLVGRDGQPVGRELLLRWQHPTLGMVPPDAIIPIAEESGLIVPIGEWVVREALTAIDRGETGFTAINLSPVQLREESFAERLIDMCREAAVDPRKIELEITEQTLLDDSRSIGRSLQLLRSAGFRIALDDFGTGYSSLSYLRRFSVDKIKIDRSFVATLETKETQAIVVAIVSLGRALGLTVAAEGVETIDQEAFLRAAGVDQFQGHLYSPPVPVERPAAKSKSQQAA